MFYDIIYRKKGFFKKERDMKKIFAIFGLLSVCGLLIIDGSWAITQKCITAACPKEAKRGGREYIQSYVGGSQCYSCDSNDYSFGQGQECGYGSVVMQKDKYNRGVGLYQCVDITGAYDEWRDYNPGRLCEGAEEVSGKHIKKYYLKKGEATTEYKSGDNVILLGGNDACYYFDCDNPDTYEMRNGKCVEKGKKNACTVTIKGETFTLDPGAEYEVDLTAEECKAVLGGTIGGDPNGRYHFLCGPECKLVGCYNNYTLSGGKCVKDNPNPQRQKSCREKNKNAGSKRLACCDVEVSETGFWRNNDCYCNNQEYDFEIVNGDHGQCVPKTTNPAVIPDNKPKCTDKNNMDEDCNCKPQYTHKNEYGQCVCNAPAELVGGKCTCDHIAGAKFENGYCKCGKNKEISGDKCDWTKEHMDKLLADVESKYSKIKSLTAGFEVSKWKDAEGNFNTARLASDSIAGVVLGTVGGVVTSHLVKKAQVKQGFEDIQCHIGGQSVASYGDEFVVGR